MHTVFENGNFDEVWFGSVNFVTKCKCRNWFSSLCVPVRFLVRFRYCAERRSAVSVRR